MKSSTEILQAVNTYLDQLPYDRQPRSLYEPIQYVLSLGGKRIRPVLMLLVYNMYKDDPESILPSACALETYHNYTLLHDDLMDNADLRRGHPTVHRRWDANTAILSGDSMLVLAYERMAQCRPDKLAAVMALFTETALEIGEGQQYDMDFETRDDVSIPEYMEMIRLKTAVLLAAALKIGALAACAPDDDIQNLYQFGINIGLAFQLRDDLLDAYGDIATFGKQTGTDIKDNKKTFLYLQALEKADPSQRQLLTSLFKKQPDNPQQKINQVIDTYNTLNIRKDVEERIAQLHSQAATCLDSIHRPDEAKEVLRQMAAKLLDRNV